MTGPFERAYHAEAPCDGCRFAVKCRAEKLLCETFSLYVSGAGQPRWRIAPRAPTHEQYLALLELEQRPLGRAKRMRAANQLRRRRALRAAAPFPARLA